MDIERYESQLEDIFSLENNMGAGSNLSCKNYYRGHRSKFVSIYPMLDLVGDLTDNSVVMDITPVPFLSYYLYLKYNCTVICSDIEKRNWKLNDRLYWQYCNLNINHLGEDKFDLFILTSVITHLVIKPSKLISRVIQATKNNGYILLEIPLGGSGHGDLCDVNINYSNHVHAFDANTAKEFVNSIEQLLLVSEQLVNGTDQHSGGFYQGLFKVNK